MDRLLLEFGGILSGHSANPSLAEVGTKPRTLQTVQCADWLCALLGRIAAYKYDPDFDEFEWAVTYFGNRLSHISSKHAKIRANGDGKDMYSNHLGSKRKCFSHTSTRGAKAVRHGV